MMNEMESVIVELFCLGFDLACFTLFYKLYNRSKKSIQQIKMAPTLDIDDDLKQKVSEYMNAIVPYVIVKGTVHSKGSAIKSNHFSDITGVIKETVVKEHKMMWSPALRFWSEVKHQVGKTVTSVPFVLKNDYFWQKVAIDVEEPFSSEYLPLNIIYDHFTPIEPSLQNTIFGWLRGERSKGFQEIESMLIEGEFITGIGQLTLYNDRLKLQPPSDDFIYFLTNMSQESLLKKLSDDMKVFRLLSMLAGCVGIFLISWITKSLYGKWKRKQQRERDARRLEEVRRLRRRDVENIITAIQSDEGNDGSFPRCVVCLTNVVEVIILECGHACLCTDCSIQITQNGLCPICRSQIVRTVAAFLP